MNEAWSDGGTPPGGRVTHKSGRYGRTDRVPTHTHQPRFRRQRRCRWGCTRTQALSAVWAHATHAVCNPYLQTHSPSSSRYIVQSVGSSQSMTYCPRARSRSAASTCRRCGMQMSLLVALGRVHLRASGNGQLHDRSANAIKRVVN
jgi:hypothetical protein